MEAFYNKRQIVPRPEMLKMVLSRLNQKVNLRKL
jgi:hypothetical protein